LERSRTAATDTRTILAKACAAYLDFARARPIIYEAMFVLPTGIHFTSEDTPSALRKAFSELVAALGANRESPEILAEVLWGALHGLATLTRSGRIPATQADLRLTVLVQTFS
ncbi:MAG: TetR family transcriptional regulator, partial [Devosia sp.]|nr:TetR family transcriptional regulator [Devosia sp.]